jgi:hypothetical protein
VAYSLDSLAQIYLDEGRYGEAEPLYCRALELFQHAGQAIEAANVELSLQTLFHLSGKSVDIALVRELTHILEKAEDQRAQKGRNLLTQLESRD